MMSAATLSQWLDRVGSDCGEQESGMDLDFGALPAAGGDADPLVAALSRLRREEVFSIDSPLPAPDAALDLPQADGLDDFELLASVPSFGPSWVPGAMPPSPELHPELGSSASGEMPQDFAWDASPDTSITSLGVGAAPLAPDSGEHGEMDADPPRKRGRRAAACHEQDRSPGSCTSNDTEAAEAAAAAAARALRSARTSESPTSSASASSSGSRYGACTKSGFHRKRRGVPLPPEEAAARRRERLQRNRESALRSRQRKRERVETLEQRNEGLSKEVEGLRRKVRQLSDENKQLRKRLAGVGEAGAGWGAGATGGGTPLFAVLLAFSVAAVLPGPAHGPAGAAAQRGVALPATFAEAASTLTSTASALATGLATAWSPLPAHASGAWDAGTAAAGRVFVSGDAATHTTAHIAIAQPGAAWSPLPAVAAVALLTGLLILGIVHVSLREGQGVHRRDGHGPLVPVPAFDEGVDLTCCIEDARGTPPSAFTQLHA